MNGTVSTGGESPLLPACELTDAQRKANLAIVEARLGSDNPNVLSPNYRDPMVCRMIPGYYGEQKKG